MKKYLDQFWQIVGFSEVTLLYLFKTVQETIVILFSGVVCGLCLLFPPSPAAASKPAQAAVFVLVKCPDIEHIN